MKARRAGGNTVLCWGFASTDALGGTQWIPTDNAILKQAIDLINPLVSAQLVADGDGACVSSDWSQAFGMWNSPSNIDPTTTVFGSGSNMTQRVLAPGFAVLYASASYPAPDPTWTGANLPIPYNLA